MYLGHIINCSYLLVCSSTGHCLLSHIDIHYAELRHQNCAAVVCDANGNKSVFVLGGDQQSYARIELTPLSPLAGRSSLNHIIHTFISDDQLPARDLASCRLMSAKLPPCPGQLLSPVRRSALRPGARPFHKFPILLPDDVPLLATRNPRRRAVSLSGNRNGHGGDCPLRAVSTV